MRNAARFIVLAAVVTASASCGDAVRDGSSPVYLVIDALTGSRGGPQSSPQSATLVSDVITNVTSPAPCSTASPCPTVFGDVGSVTLRAPLKNIGNGTVALTPTTNNEVTITRYHIDYVRADGRNTPGVDVPYSFDGAITSTIPANGTATVGFELMRLVAKEESPLVQLRTSNNFLSLIAQITFYGQDRTGNAVSVTGSILCTVGNFGDF